jgi:hypothetical protein
MSLDQVRTFRVPRAIVGQTEDALRAAGSDGYELFVLWSGVIDHERLTIRTPHVPKQHSYRTRDGLFVRVDGSALHQLNSWLFQNGEVLAAQLHAHPTEAFHSETDSGFPIVTSLGGLSIVAPDFARDGVFTQGTAAYRLTTGGWAEMTCEEVDATIEVH